jgi:hypothetical protein
MTTTESQLDASELEQRAKSMYEEVALEPDREFHFETWQENTAYRVLSEQAESATRKYGVTSISLLARRH